MTEKVIGWYEFGTDNIQLAKLTAYKVEYDPSSDLYIGNGDNSCSSISACECIGSLCTISDNCSNQFSEPTCSCTTGSLQCTYEASECDDYDVTSS